jgi:hypothetical protein
MRATYRIIIPLILFCFVAAFNSNAQNCKDYENKCQSAPKGFKKSSLSRAFSIRKMKKIKLNTTLLGGNEYHISVCGKVKLGNIHIRIITDDTYKSVLYDNAADGFSPTKIFEVEETTKISIEISAPQFFTDSESECAGVNIAYKSIPGNR